MANQTPKSKTRLDWELLAKEYGISGYEKLENKKLFRALQEKTPTGKSVSDEVARVRAKNGTSAAVAKTDVAAVEEVKAEILAPGNRYEHAVQVHAPQIHNHIAPPTVNYGRSESPAWHEMLDKVWTISLHMVLGAALYAVVTHTPLFTNVALLAGR